MLQDPNSLVTLVENILSKSLSDDSRRFPYSNRTGTISLTTPTTLSLLKRSRHESGFWGQWRWYKMEEEVATAL